MVEPKKTIRWQVTIILWSTSRRHALLPQMRAVINDEEYLRVFLVLQATLGEVLMNFDRWFSRLAPSIVICCS